MIGCRARSLRWFTQNPSVASIVPTYVVQQYHFFRSSACWKPSLLFNGYIHFGCPTVTLSLPVVPKPLRCFSFFEFSSLSSSSIIAYLLRVRIVWFYVETLVVTDLFKRPLTVSQPVLSGSTFVLLSLRCSPLLQLRRHLYVLYRFPWIVRPRRWHTPLHPFPYIVVYYSWPFILLFICCL